MKVVCKSERPNFSKALLSQPGAKPLRVMTGRLQMQKDYLTSVICQLLFILKWKILVLWMSHIVFCPSLFLSQCEAWRRRRREGFRNKHSGECCSLCLLYPLTDKTTHAPDELQEIQYIKKGRVTTKLAGCLWISIKWYFLFQTRSVSKPLRGFVYLSWRTQA